MLDVEATVGVDIERALQSAVAWPHAFVVVNTSDLLHFPAALTVLAIAFRWGRTTVFAIMRNSVVACTSVALIIDLFVPMPPPRRLPGFVDVRAIFGPDRYKVAGSESANQFAAMLSMQVAWAMLTGYAIRHLSSH